MTDRPLPAFTRDSVVVRLPGIERLEDLTPEWAVAKATGAGIRVAIVDSGVEADHPDLEGCVEEESGLWVRSMRDGSVGERPGPHPDGYGHGTACAGIVHSIAPDAKIVSVRVLDDRLLGKAPAFMRGLEYALSLGCEVINLSLGTSRREFALQFHELCDRAYFSNSMVITAASNVLRDSYPSLFSSVTSVACSLTKDRLRIHYNPNPPTEFLARGVDVDLCWRGHDHMTGTGNSYAAPHLSGLVALVRSKHRELRPFQVKTVLWAMSANVLEAPPIAGRITRSVLSLSAEDRPHTRRLTLTRPAAATWPAPEVMSRASGLGDPRFAP